MRQREGARRLDFGQLRRVLCLSGLVNDVSVGVDHRSLAHRIQVVVHGV